MFKKVILSSLLTFIIITNLILWPYLYKEFKAEDTLSDSAEQSVSTETAVSEETVLPDADEVEDEKDQNDEEQEEITSEDSKEEFRVIDIK
ncbi:hypothetical protein IMZ08_03410 [Bacillus luteolus]|uniref:Secreted protein n=1 Tax=Litchfieldia luteola TaxID=682179 RepID=A0ABR9QF34_9BACI|nr:hypothetical protein [Cytobacillus luteolus]MBE4907105.1 hypothetical protein [Cytobacillus luteolus]MBP1943426.1 hypothetical protein [Cytobacillus luteolus]